MRPRSSAVKARGSSPRTAGTILDFSSLAECSNLGHQHPRVVAAIREQAARLTFVTNAWGAEPRARLAEMLLEKSGFEGGRVFFTLGGADANEHAVKFARQASGKPRGLDRDARSLVSRCELRGDGFVRRHAHGAARRPGRVARAARAASVRVSLPVRHDERRGMRRSRPRDHIAAAIDKQGPEPSRP